MFKNITNTIWIISIVSLLNDISGEMLYAVLPLYFVQVGYGGFIIGLVEGIAELVSGCTKIYVGSISDSISRRVPFVQLGYLLSTIGKPFIGFTQQFFPILSLRIIDKIGKGIRSSPRDALLMDECTSETRATVFGFHRSMDTLGAVIGPLLGLLYLYYFPTQYSSLFKYALIPLLLATFLTLLLKEKKRNMVVKTNFSVKSIFAYYQVSNIEYKKYLHLFILFALVNSSDMFLLLKLKELGVDETKIIFSYVSFNIMYALSAYPIGILADRIGSKKMYIIGLVLYAFVYFIFYKSNIPNILISSMVLYGLFYSFTHGTAKSLLLQHTSKDTKATALGLFDGLSSIAILIANIGIGFLWYKMGSSFVFILTSISTCIILLLFLAKKDTINNM